MFLDEELTKIHEENGVSPETSKKLIVACMARIEKGNGVDAWLNSLKRADASWKLFCKKHDEYNSDGFRNALFMLAGDTKEGLKKALNW